MELINVEQAKRNKNNLLNERITLDSFSIKTSIEKYKEGKNEINTILNKVINYNENNVGQNLVFECPNESCPFIPSLKYYEFTQSIATKCRSGHEYHLNLNKYYEIIFNKMNSAKFCNICLKKNYTNVKSIPDFYCIDCKTYLCKRCEITHSSNHQILSLNKVNNYCPKHSSYKFSGFCSNCHEDLCIHCLKSHFGSQHSLFKYLDIIPNKDQIDKYREKIKKKLKYIDMIKNILFGKDVIQDESIKNIFLEFFDKMKLKYYFYDAQLKTFDKVKFNKSIIKNFTDLLIIPQNFLENMYSFIKSNLNEYNKVQILNKILSAVLKYQNPQDEQNKIKNIIQMQNINNKYLSHFEFKHLFTLKSNNNIKFLYLLKNGKFAVSISNDGLHIYDDGTLVELLYIDSKTDILDMCENDSGLLFLLKKTMIEIIKINENNNGFIIIDKILFKSIDKVNFICTLNSQSIVVSRTKKNEGSLDIWTNRTINNTNSKDKVKDKKTTKKINHASLQRRNNIINLFNIDRRMKIILRGSNNNGNDNDNNNNNNINNNNNNDNNIINNNNNIINNNNNNNENSQTNLNIEDNQKLEQDSNIINDNIILQEVPEAPQISQINNSTTNNNNNNNNFGLDFNLIGMNRNINQRQNRNYRYPIHFIRYIRDQLRGLVNNLDQQRLTLENKSLISSIGIYGSKFSKITHINKVIENRVEVRALLDWDENYFICSEFHIQRKSFKRLRVYSNQNYEPWGLNHTIKIKDCSRDKNALIKINDDILAVCYDHEKTNYGISLISFRTREEVSRFELPKFNLVKKVNMNKSNYLFVLLENCDKNNFNQDFIKVLKIYDQELVESSSYFFEPWMNTYVYNKNNCSDNKFKINENNINDDLDINQKRDKGLQFMNIFNSIEDSNHYEKEIVSMIQLKNNTFVLMNKFDFINFYQVD